MSLRASSWTGSATFASLAAVCLLACSRRDSGRVAPADVEAAKRLGSIESRFLPLARFAGRPFVDSTDQFSGGRMIFELNLRPMLHRGFVQTGVSIASARYVGGSDLEVRTDADLDHLRLAILGRRWSGKPTDLSAEYRRSVRAARTRLSKVEFVDVDEDERPNFYLEPEKR